MKVLRIPQRFYDDHAERDLPAPEILKETSKHYWINAESEHLSELPNDADFYSDYQHWPRECWGLCKSANATANAIRLHQRKVA